MPQRTPQEKAEYMRQYRERKRLEALVGPEVANAVVGAKNLQAAIDDLGAGVPEPTKKHKTTRKWSEVRRALGAPEPPMYPGTDRRDGLPRSNYYGDDINAWQKTIQKLDQKDIDKILGKIVTPARPMK